MRRIPLTLLPETATVKLPDASAAYGGAFANPFEVEHVRFDSTASIRRTDYQLQDTTTGLLFIDAVNSDGAVEIPAGAKVSLDGGTTWSSVNACHRYEDFDGHVHHWEVELR